MKRFQQNVCVGDSKLCKKEWGDGYRALSVDGGVPDKFFGICYNVSAVTLTDLQFVCGYEMTERLFACVIGDKSVFPLESRPHHDLGWAVRQKWCAAFAESFTTGVIEIDSEMEESLRQPIDVSLII